MRRKACQRGFNYREVAAVVRPGLLDELPVCETVSVVVEKASTDALLNLVPEQAARLGLDGLVRRNV